MQAASLKIPGGGGCTPASYSSIAINDKHKFTF